MRILYVLGTFPMLSSETFILSEMVELVNLGHEITIIADLKESGNIHNEAVRSGLISRTITPDREYFRGIDKLKDFLGKSLLDLVRRPIITIRSLVVSVYYMKDPWSVMDVYLGLRSAVDLEIDLVHSPFSIRKHVLKAYLIHLQKKRPFTLTMRAREIFQSQELNKLKKFQRIIEEASAVITISEYNKRLIEKNFGIRDIRIIRSSINTDKFKPSIVDKRRKITTICRFIEKKGVEYLIEAISILKKKGYRDLEFLLIGEGSLLNNYRDMIENLGISDLLTIKEPMTQEEVMFELSDTMVFCLPSVVASDKDMDMLPNVIKEAMSMGIPVVTSRVPGIEELIKDGQNGIIVQQRDPSGIANALIRLMENDDIRSSLGKMGRKTIISDFSARNETIKLEKVFKMSV